MEAARRSRKRQLRKDIENVIDLEQEKLSELRFEGCGNGHSSWWIGRRSKRLTSEKKRKEKKKQRDGIFVAGAWKLLSVLWSVERRDPP